MTSAKSRKVTWQAQLRMRLPVESPPLGLHRMAGFKHFGP